MLHRIDIIAPAVWAPYLVNHDDTSITQNEKQEIIDWFVRHGLNPRHVVSCSDTEDIAKIDGVLTAVVTYTLLN